MTARNTALFGLFMVALFVVFGLGLITALVASAILVTIFLLSYFTRDYVRTEITKKENDTITTAVESKWVSGMAVDTPLPVSDVPAPRVDEKLIGKDY